jgi:undecaprenyl diphosphate synthase
VSHDYSKNLIGVEDRVLPRHVAIIMDGNGRWARERRLPRVEGHRMGAKTVQMVVEESRRLGIRYLTLFAFSTENWKRPRLEVNTLMRLFRQYLLSERELLIENGVRLRAIGRRESLPEVTRTALEEVERATEHLQGMELILALSYGGRDELVQATQSIAKKVKEGALAVEEISEKTIQDNLFAPDIPDPDLLIRTSREYRVSNFLLWQLAYSEIVVSSLYWPAFTKDAFMECLTEYSTRSRRFGLTSEQLLQAHAG